MLIMTPQESVPITIKSKEELQPLDEEEDTPYSDDFDEQNQDNESREEDSEDSYTEADSLISSAKY